MQHISLILFLWSFVDRGLGLPINYTKSNTPIFKAVAKHGKQPERFNLLAKTVNKRPFGRCAVNRLILLPRFRLSGFYKGDQRGTVQSGNTAKGFVITFLVTAVCNQRIWYDIVINYSSGIISTISSRVQFRATHIFSSVSCVTVSSHPSFAMAFVVIPAALQSCVLLIFLSIISFHNLL